MHDLKCFIESEMCEVGVQSMRICNKNKCRYFWKWHFESGIFGSGILRVVLLEVAFLVNDNRQVEAVGTLFLSQNTKTKYQERKNASVRRIGSIL